MNIEIECKYFDFIKISSIKDLFCSEHFEKKNISFGAFSNSIYFTIPRMKFGQVLNKKLDFEMDFVLTNSDSYGHMTGEFEEHASLKSSRSTKLLIDDLCLKVNLL